MNRAVEHTPSRPDPALRPTDALGLAFVRWAAAATACGWWLATCASIAPWAAGQAILAAAFLQWFALLHECGHRTLFRTRRLNDVAGWIAGFFALIPFRCWKPIHTRHHRWTGWQDLDPTDPQPGPARAMVVDAVVLAAAYVTVVAALGPAALVRTAGVALFLSLMVQDVIILSQHTHVPMGLSGGRAVAPYRAREQGRFTRSLRLPAWLSRMLLHLDAHEVHHLYPAVPGYRLREIPHSSRNEVGWAQWVPAARAVPGDVFLFRNRNQSGLNIMTAAALNPVACGAFLVTAFTLSGLAHTAWLAAPFSRRLAVPLDRGCVIGGRRLLGDHKTVRGFLVMVPATGISFAALAALTASGPGIPAWGLWPFPPATYGLLGTWTALGFMAGELPNSFIKRRLDIPPGAAAPGRRLRLVFFLADRLDSTVGMLLALALVVPVSLPLCLFVLLAGPSMHAAFSVALFLLRVKARAA